MSPMKITRSLQVLLFAIFMLSALGKFLDPVSAALNIAEILGVPGPMAKILAVLLGIFEIGLALIIWRRPLPKILLAIPLAFAAVLGYTHWQGSACGCFGNLPFLSQLPFVGHLLLLAGMFLGMFQLAYRDTLSPGNDDVPGTTRGGVQSSTAKSRWPGLAAIVLILAAFVSWPISNRPSSPPQAADPDYVTLAQLKQAIDRQSAIIIDARSDFEYEIAHIPGAINIPQDSDQLQELYEKYGLANRPVIVYCAGVHCDKAERLAQRLRELGHRQVKVFPGGWDEWIENE